jgi:hypothetical protein
MTGRKEQLLCVQSVFIEDAYVQYALREHLIHRTKDIY